MFLTVRVQSFSLAQSVSKNQPAPNGALKVKNIMFNMQPYFVSLACHNQCRCLANKHWLFAKWPFSLAGQFRNGNCLHMLSNYRFTTRVTYCCKMISNSESCSVFNNSFIEMDLEMINNNPMKLQ